MFKILINYLYHLDYPTNGLDHVNVDGQIHEATALEVDVRMFSLGDRYMIPSLRELALSNFKSEIARGNTEDFMDAIKLVYKWTTCPAPDGGLRDLVLDAAAGQIDTLIERVYLEAMLAVPQFGMDLSLRLIDKKKGATYLCPSCENTFKADLHQYAGYIDEIPSYEPVCKYFCCPYCGYVARGVEWKDQEVE